PGPPRLVLGFALDALRGADEQTLLAFAELLGDRLPGPPRLVLGFALDALRGADEQTLLAFAELLGDR
ncbi:hypothetical protein WA841_33715, partial [Pseudomonas aeruginosa]